MNLNKSIIAVGLVVGNAIGTAHAEGCTTEVANISSLTGMEVDFSKSSPDNYNYKPPMPGVDLVEVRCSEELRPLPIPMFNMRWARRGIPPHKFMVLAAKAGAALAWTNEAKVMKEIEACFRQAKLRKEAAETWHTVVLKSDVFFVACNFSNPVNGYGTVGIAGRSMVDKE